MKIPKNIGSLILSALLIYATIGSVFLWFLDVLLYTDFLFSTYWYSTIIIWYVFGMIIWYKYEVKSK